MLDPVRWLTSQSGDLRLAPMRWRGNLGFEERLVRADEGARRNQSIEFGNVDLATYISQPWLAQVRVNLGILATQQRGSGVVEADHAGLLGDRAVSLTGGASVSVFPTSRFPFTASFESSDSRASGEATPSDYVNRMLSLRQSYRTPLGDQLYLGSIERSSLTSASFGRDTVTSLNATLQRTFETQIVDASGSWSQNRRTQDGSGSEVSRLSAHHNWRPDDTSTVDTYASFSATDFTTSLGGLRSRYVQVNSFGSWRPDEDSPLFVTGAVRMADAVVGSGDAADARTIGANAAAAYAFGTWANLVASGSVANLRGGASNDTVSNESVAANLNPPPLTYAGFNYSVNSSASASNQTGGADGNDHVILAQANHQLSRGFKLASSLSLNASVTQGYSVQDDSRHDMTRTLMHSGTLGVRVNPTPASDFFVSLSAGDSQSHGGREDRFRLFNLQTTGQLQLGVFSLVSANLSVQQYRQRLPEDEQSHTTLQRSGTAAYTHLRVLGIPRLRWILSATFNDVQLESRLLGDANAPHEQYSRLYESRLQYDIGRLEFRLGTRIATLDGKNDRQLFFRVNRQFGVF